MTKEYMGSQRKTEYARKTGWSSPSTKSRMISEDKNNVRLWLKSIWVHKYITWQNLEQVVKIQDE